MTREDIKHAIEKLNNLWRTSQFYEAKTLAFELLKLQAIQEDNESLAKVYNILGLIYWNLSHYPKALEYISKSLYINEEIGNKNSIANNYGNIGLVYLNLADYTKALEYYQKALQINEDIGNKDGIAFNYGNIGLVYWNMSDYPKALENLSKSLHINEEIGNKNGIAANLGNIGLVYVNLTDYPKALENYQKALDIYEDIGKKDGIANALSNIGLVYENLANYPKALEYFQNALLITEEIGNKVGIANNLGNIGIVYKELFDYPKAIEYYSKALHINEEIGNKVGIANNLGNSGNVYNQLSDYKKALEFLEKANSLSVEIGAKKVTMIYLKEISEVYEKIGDLKNELSYFKQYITLEKEILSEETKKQAERFDNERKTAEREKQLAIERTRFEERENILKNILPDSITDRLVKGENPIADNIESASVLFMDLVGFTYLSTLAPPKQLVYLLDTIFTNADEVVENFGLEKIKTIGDGYLAVANVTSSLDEHQKATALAALQLLETMRDFTVNIPSDLGDMNWTKEMKDIEIRIGIHTGEVVAGIIGKNKYTYDLWGDAVNVASRMESNSEAGRIHISEAFAKSIESNPEFSIIPRGEINIKGKGTMKTFWLEKGK